MGHQTSSELIISPAEQAVLNDISTLFPCFTLTRSRKSKQTSERTCQHNAAFTINAESTVLTSSVLHRTRRHICTAHRGLPTSAEINFTAQMGWHGTKVHWDPEGRQNFTDQSLPFGFSDLIRIHMYEQRANSFSVSTQYPTAVCRHALLQQFSDFSFLYYSLALTQCGGFNLLRRDCERTLFNHAPQSAQAYWIWKL